MTLVSTPSPIRSSEMSDEEIVRRGIEIYETRLKEQLEPVHNGMAIAISVEDGDFEIAERSPEADEALRRRHPDGIFFFGRVGGDHAVHWGAGQPYVRPRKS
jgi:hypothetical protein